MKPIRRILPYYTPYRADLIAGLILVVVATAITSVIPWLLRLGIDAVTDGAPLSRVWTLAGQIVCVAVFAGFLRYSMREILNRISRNIEYDLRNDLFAHLTSLDAEWFGRNRTG